MNFFNSCCPLKNEEKREGDKMNKIVLVTGGNSGIGYATAQLFKKTGYTVFITGRRPEQVKQAAAKIDATPLIADFAKPETVKNLAKHFHESGIDVLVNNAGIARFMPIDELTKDIFAKFFNINIFSPLLLIKELSTALEKRQGSIVNVSSIITGKGVINGSLYAATKGALEAVTRCLALELAPRNIRINVVAPGGIDTSIIQKIGIDEQQVTQLRTQQEARIPMGRYGTSEEIAQVILAQAESIYTTGSVWRVDGGVNA